MDDLRTFPIGKYFAVERIIRGWTSTRDYVLYGYGTTEEAALANVMTQKPPHG